MSRRIYKSIHERGQDVLEFFKDFRERNGVSPTYDEIVRGVGLSAKSHVYRTINYLIDEGKLERVDGMARGLRLPGWKPSNQVVIHLKGAIAANNKNPLVVFEESDPETTIEIPHDLIPKNTKLADIYALRVKGDSMEDALIADGDMVILKRDDFWKDGDIVAVWLHEEGALTLKQLYRGRDDTVKLRPRSHKHETRIEQIRDIQVQGRVVAVLRKYTG